MNRSIPLSSLTEREKDTTILILAGYNGRLRKLLEELGDRSAVARRKVDELAEEYGPRLRFLGAAYEREVAIPEAVQRKAAIHDRVWASAEARA